MVGMAIIAGMLAISFLLPFQSTHTWWVFGEIAMRSLLVASLYIGLVFKLQLSDDLQVYLLKAGELASGLFKKR